MCWYLYGAVHGNINEKDLNAINQNHQCRLVSGTRHAVKMAIQEDNWDYRITKDYEMCDCGSAIGGGDPDAAQVQDMAVLMDSISELPGVKDISFCLTWVLDRNKHESTLKRSETDFVQLLTNLKPRTLYTIDCQK